MNLPPQYAAIPQAYGFGEVICSSRLDEGESIFDLLRRKKCSMQKSLELLRLAADEAPEDLNPAIKASILDQMNHPQWRTYVAAQLGMM